MDAFVCVKATRDNGLVLAEISIAMRLCGFFDDTPPLLRPIDILCLSHTCKQMLTVYAKYLECWARISEILFDHPTKRIIRNRASAYTYTVSSLQFQMCQNCYTNYCGFESPITAIRLCYHCFFSRQTSRVLLFGSAGAQKTAQYYYLQKMARDPPKYDNSHLRKKAKIK